MEKDRTKNFYWDKYDCLPQRIDKPKALDRFLETYLEMNTKKSQNLSILATCREWGIRFAAAKRFDLYDSLSHWQRVGDSNPRYALTRTTV